MLGRSLTRAAVAAGMAGSLLLVVAHTSDAVGGRSTAPVYGPYSPSVYGPTIGADTASLMSPVETGGQGRKVQ